MDRPDAEYRQLLALEGVDTKSETSIAAGLSGIVGGWVLVAAGKKAQAMTPDVLIIRGTDRAAALNQCDSAVAEHLATAADPVGGLIDLAWIQEAIKRALLARAQDPAILDTVADWIAPYLV